MKDRIELRLANLDCEHDAAKLRRGLQQEAGVLDVTVQPGAARVAVDFDPSRTKPETIHARLRELGFPPAGLEQLGGPAPPWRNPKVLASAASGLLLVVGWTLGLADAPWPAALVSYVLAMLVGGYYFGREALEELVFEREVGIELLMAVAASVAALMGQPGEGAMLVFLYSISEAAEGYTAERTRSAVRALMKLAPRTVWVRRDGGEVEVPVETLSPGDVFLVRPGSGVATDGVIESGSSALNEAPVTGESMPVERGPGDPVLAGTLNGQGALEVRATKSFGENTLSRIIRMVEEAQERKGQSQRFVERFGRRYSPLVLAAGIAIAVVPPLVIAASWSEWIGRATVFVVAAAPCALAISIPIGLVAAIGTGARKGVLIKGGVHLEELARARIVALDKTGTLTRGEPAITDVVVLEQAPAEFATEETLLALAAGIERWSEHPLARAIVRSAQARGLAPAAVSGFQSHTGAGAEGLLGGRKVLIGSRRFFGDQAGAALPVVNEQLERLEAQGKTLVFLGEPEIPWGVVALRDSLRDTARQAVARLRGVGIERVVMLTGDNERTARAVAEEVGLDEVHAALKPEDKAKLVRELQQRYGHVVMVGDGVNDAPALAEAAVGVAMGAAGTDVALETADVALMADDLDKLVYALELARRNGTIVRQNLGLSALVIGALVVGALTGVLSLPLAVLGHELSEFVVIGNGLRLLGA